MLSLFWLHLVYNGWLDSSQNRNSKCIRINFSLILLFYDHWAPSLTCFHTFWSLACLHTFHFRFLFHFSNQACEAEGCTRLVSWNCFGSCIGMCVCVSVCPPSRPLITSGVIWCDIGHVRLVKQVLRLFPAFNYFIGHLPSIKWMGVTILTQHVVHAYQRGPR